MGHFQAQGPVFSKFVYVACSDWKGNGGWLDSLKVFRPYFEKMLKSQNGLKPRSQLGVDTCPKIPKREVQADGGLRIF